MNEQDGYDEVFLRPGDLYFGAGRTRIRTLLGSCVSVTLWQPRARVGGMCHYMMPTRAPATHAHAGHAGLGSHGGHDDLHAFDGRYADEALALLVAEIEALGLAPRTFEAKLFGGGRQFAGQSAAGFFDVPERNVQAGIDLLGLLGIPVTATHLGGAGHRQVLMDLANGHVWMRHSARAREVAGA